MSKSSQIQDLMVQPGADIPTTESLNFGGNVITSQSQDNAVNVYGRDQTLHVLAKASTLTLEQPQPLTSNLMANGAAAGNTMILDNNPVNIGGGCKSDLFTHYQQAAANINLQNNAGLLIIS